MNLYRAAILTMDMFLLEYIFPNAKLSESDIWYINQLIDWVNFQSSARDSHVCAVTL